MRAEPVLEAREVQLSITSVTNAVRSPERGPISETPRQREVFRDAETRECPRPAMDREWRYGEERRRRENAREGELISAVYMSERRYLEVRLTEPERAERVSAMASALRFAPELRSREQALVLHGQAWHRRALECDPSLWRAQEDNLMAVALVARERDDDHHALTRATRERLATSGRSTQGAERAALRDELREFLRRDVSSDAQACRREMHAAVEHPSTDDDPRLYALALEAFPHRPFRMSPDERRAASPRPVFDEERTQVGAIDVERLESELIDLRTAHAMNELSDEGLVRAERVARALDAAIAENERRASSARS